MLKISPNLLKKFTKIIVSSFVFLFTLGVFLFAVSPQDTVHAAVLPPNFQDEVVMSGLVNPMAIRFASDGRVFVAEKSGIIKVFDNINDTTPTTFADLRKNVYNFWDRGLLGLALHPDFPTNPSVYVTYTYDAVIGGTAPRWGTTTSISDPCPTPPGPTQDGCVVSGRLSKLQASGNVMIGPEQVLVEDWCQQFPSHSMGSIVFGADGSLYMSGGEGANFNALDYGQFGNPVNPCNDPANEGGSFRSQDLQTTSDPTGLSGSIIRINPDTGDAMPTNPLINNANNNAKRIIAYGGRNPFRMAFRPGTTELWIGDVGLLNWDEINVLDTSNLSSVKNFGWPCYEGVGKQEGFESGGFALCNNLYNQPAAVTQPFFTYHHAQPITSADVCPYGSTSISGIAFQPTTNTSYPSQYNGALYFADYSRNCIWVMFRNSSGNLDPSTVQNFVAHAAGPVELQVSPEGELYYPDFDNGRIHRIRYSETTSNLPAPWENSDVGTVATPGSATISNGTYTLNATGSDIWDTVDHFHYVYQPLNGDGSITARITSLQNTDQWAKGGVMIRQSLSASSAHAMLILSSQYGTAFQRRVEDGAWSMHTDGPFVSAPYWLRLTRLGNEIIAATSANGSTWSEVGRQTINMTNSVYIGLALTSHNDQVLNTSIFDNVTVSTSAANKLPTPIITTPVSSLTWKVGDTVNFSGTATDPEDGTLPPSALTWTLIMHHCPSNCHTHQIQTFDGASSGSFVAPDHEYPSYLELSLTAKDSKNESSKAAVELQPKTATLTFQSTPISGFSLAVGAVNSATSFVRTVILNSVNSLSAPLTQLISNKNYDFLSWSHGGGANQTYTATGNAVLTVNYKEVTGGSTPQTLFISDLPFTTVTNGWGPVEKDQSNGEQALNDGRVITLNGTTFTKGLGVHAASEVNYNMAAKCTNFSASVGVDDEVSQGSVIFQVYADATKVYDSGIMRGTTATKSVSVDVTGKNNLRLVVTDGGDNNGQDHGDWANARVTCNTGSGTPIPTPTPAPTTTPVPTVAPTPAPTTPPTGEVTRFLSDLVYTVVTNGWGPVEKDKSNNDAPAGDGNPIILNGVTFAKGLGVHAASEITYNLAAKCSNFSASVGVDDEVGSNGSVVFQVLTDNVKVYDSGTMTGATATKDLSVNTAGKNQLKLVVTIAGDNTWYDHADWANARVTCTP